jgi:hypothetical protein
VLGAYGMYLGESVVNALHRGYTWNWLTSATGYMDFGDYIAEAEEQSRLKAHALIKKYGQVTRSVDVDCYSYFV